MGLCAPIQKDFRQQEGLCGIALEFYMVAINVRMRLLRAEKQALRIHDILVLIRIRIWIRRSMPLTNGSGCGSGSCYYRH
jgi:hypothetical protein